MEFSVLMSLYFKEKLVNYLACLQSIKSQTIMPTEVIIVYDGCIGSDLDLITKKYQYDLNITICKLDENIGLGRALNHGLEFCNYELVARMDTDDICVKNRFELQLKSFLHDANLDILGGAIIEFDDEKNTERNKKLPLNLSEIKNYSIKKNPLNHMTVMFRKSKILACGGYRHHLFMEDYNLWLRCIACGYKIENLSDVLVRARVGDDMIKKRRGFKYIRSEVELLRIKMNLTSANPFYLFFIFVQRSVPRLFPRSILALIYSWDRK